MKEKLFSLLVFASVFIISCNNNVLPPVIVSNPYANPHAGDYYGLFTEIYNGVDSNGVFKDSSSYPFTMTIHDEGNLLIGFDKGNLVFDSVMVDDSGAFVAYYSESVPYVDSLGNDQIREDTTQVSGHFTTTDSIYVTYHALGGGYLPSPNFTLIHLSFKGKKLL